MSYRPRKPDRSWEWARWVQTLPGYPEDPPGTGVRGQLVQHPFRTLLIILGLFAVGIFGSYWWFGGNPALSADHEAVVGTVEFDGTTCCPLYREIDGEEYVFIPAMKEPGFFSSDHPRDLALRVVRMEEDGRPEEAASLDAPIDSFLPNSTALAGSTLYIPLGITDEDAYGLWTVDVSDPAAPSDAGLIETEHRYKSLTTGEGDLLIAHARGYFDIYDASDPAELSLIASYRRPIGDVQRMQVDGDRLFYRESGTNRVRIDDISDPENPEPLGRYEIEGALDQRIMRARPRITSADERLEVSVPPGQFHGFVVAGDYLYVAASDMGVEIVDVSDPTATDSVNHIQPDGRAVRTVIMNGDLSVLTADEASHQQLTYELHRFDLSDPVEPEPLDVVDNIKAVPGRQAMGTGGGMLFLGLNDTLLVLEPGN